MSIFDVQHQPRAHRIIQRALASQRMPHAYLFAGSEGVGKEMLAHGLARLLLCASPVREPWPEGAGGPGEAVDACGQCKECVLARAGTHPDLFLIHRQLNRQHPDSTVRKQKALTLSVDVIRHFLVERATTRPVRGRAKVFIVREGERMNDAAQNCLLKTLEEPPGSMFIIVLTTSLDGMLPTTRSRCQLVHFQTLPVGYVADRVAQLRPEADPAAAAYVARQAGGSLGAALRALDDGVVGLKRPWGQRLVEIGSGRSRAAHTLAKPFLDDAKVLGKGVAARDPDVSDTDATRAGLRTMLSLLADFYLDALRRASGAELPMINTDQPDIVARLAEHGGDVLSSALRDVAAAESHLDRNANMDLALESLFIRLSHLGAAPVAG